MANAMPEFDITKKSRPVVVTSYQSHWVDDFTQIARHIRDLVGHAAIRIDHIGSTAVPGLAAKDVIDVQVTVFDLDEAGGLTKPLRDAGFRQGTAFQYDVFHKKPEADPELRKLFMREPEANDEHIYISGNSGGSTSGMRCCFATIFAHRKMFGPSTNSSNAERLSFSRRASTVM
jgi:GrpB-like predicted nucleotidyltransferase (UPF0157 family)